MDAVTDDEAARDRLAAALILAGALLSDEGYDRDPDYTREWEQISNALEEIAAAEETP